MSKFKLSLPNDYESEADDAAREAAGQDYEDVAIACKSAGMVFVSATDYGAIWEGTDEQFAACLEVLPEWAQRYSSKLDDEE